MHVCVGGKPRDPAGAELCEEAAGGSADAAGADGAGEEGGRRATGEGREEECRAGEQRWVEVVHTRKHTHAHTFRVGTAGGVKRVLSWVLTKNTGGNTLHRNRKYLFLIGWKLRRRIQRIKFC